MSVQESVPVSVEYEQASRSGEFGISPEATMYEIHYYLEQSGAAGGAGSSVTATLHWTDDYGDASFTTPATALDNAASGSLYVSGVVPIKSVAGSPDPPFGTELVWWETTITITGGTPQYSAFFVLSKPSFPHEIQVP